MDSRPRIKTRHPGVFYRERPDGSRQYLIWFMGTDGKPHWQNTPGNEGDAKRARAKIINDMAGGKKVAPTRILFADFAKEWLDGQAGLAPNSIETYRSSINVHLIPRLGHRTKLGDVDVNKVARLVVSMQKDGKKAWTIRGSLATLSRIMGAAARRGMIPVNPVTQLDRSERPKGDAAPINILDSDEIILLLENTTTTYRTLFAVAIFTGLRISEILNLRWGDVDWEEGILRVQGTKTRAAKREVVLMPALQRRLAQHSLEHGGSVFVFETSTGRQMRRGTVNRWGLKNALLGAGIEKHIRFHDLRHTYASMMISEGYDLNYVAAQMGHSSPHITLNNYAHLIDAKKKREEARQRMEGAYGQLLGQAEGQVEISVVEPDRKETGS